MMMVAQFILFWGVFSWLPRVSEFYRKTYFPNVAPVKNGFFKKAATVFFLSLINRYCFTSWGAPFLIMGAIILLATWGAVLLDFRFKIIPDRFQLVGFLGVATFIVAAHYFLGKKFSTEFFVSLFVGMLLPILMFAAAYLYKTVRKQPDVALGLGDVKLLLWQALFLGSYTWHAFFSASLFALLMILPAVLLRRTQWQSSFAFGPYLAAGFVLQIVLENNVFSSF